MKLSFVISVTTVLLVTITLPMEGKRITMFPLSARDVYRVLREAGREDAIPEGRIVTQGIAAVSGFALGLTKGIGGSLLVDLAIASGLLGGTAQQQQPQQTQTQEVCFSSRSLDEIYDGEDEDVPEGRQTTIPIGTITNTAGTTPTATSLTSPTTTVTNAPTTTVTNAPTTTVTNAPTTTGTNTNTNTGTTVDNGGGTNTQSGTTTQTGTGGAINCVVIQQPPTNTNTNNNNILFG